MATEAEALAGIIAAMTGARSAYGDPEIDVAARLLGLLPPDVLRAARRLPERLGSDGHSEGLDLEQEEGRYVTPTTTNPFSLVDLHGSHNQKSHGRRGKPANLRFDALTKAGDLGGSTGARLVTDASGKRWVSKRGGSEGHLREEQAADDAYRALGIPVPPGRIVEPGEPGGPSKPTKVAEYVEGTLLKGLKGEDREKAHAELRKGFAADALLGNWDVLGLDLDNVLVGDDGTVYRIDNGGALRYRAMGKKKKPEQFGPEVTELKTMRDPARSAGRVYGGVTDDELARQIDEVAGRRGALLASLPPGLRGPVAARLDWMERWRKEREADLSANPFTVVDLHLPGEHNQKTHGHHKLVKGVGVHTGAPKQGGKTNFLVKPGSGTVRAWRGTIKTGDYKKEVAPGVAPGALVSGTINPKTGSVVAYAPAGMDPKVAQAAIKQALPGAKKVTVVPAKTQGKGSGQKTTAPPLAPATANTDADKQAAVGKLGAVLKGVAQGKTAANPFSPKEPAPGPDAGSVPEGMVLETKFGAGVYSSPKPDAEWVERFAMDAKGDAPLFWKSGQATPGEVLSEVQDKGLTGSVPWAKGIYSAEIPVKGSYSPDLKHVTIVSKAAPPDPPPALVEKMKGWFPDAGDMSWNGKQVKLGDETPSPTILDLPGGGKAILQSNGKNVLVGEENAKDPQKLAAIKEKFPSATHYGQMGGDKKPLAPLYAKLEPPKGLGTQNGNELYDKPPAGSQKYTGFVLNAEGGDKPGLFWDNDGKASTLPYELKNQQGQDQPAETQLDSPGTYGAYNSKTGIVTLKDDAPDPTPAELETLKAMFPDAKGWKKGGSGTTKSLTPGTPKTAGGTPIPAPDPPKEKPGPKPPVGGYAGEGDQLFDTAEMFGGDSYVKTHGPVYGKPVDPDALTPGGHSDKKLEGLAYYHNGKQVSGHHWDQYGGTDDGGAGDKYLSSPTVKTASNKHPDVPTKASKGYWQVGHFDPQTNTVHLDADWSEPTKGVFNQVKKDYPSAEKLVWNGKTVDLKGNDPKPKGHKKSYAGGGYSKPSSYHQPAKAYSSAASKEIPGPTNPNKPGGHWGSLNEANEWAGAYWQDWAKSLTGTEAGAISKMKGHTGGVNGHTASKKTGKPGSGLRGNDGDVSKLDPSGQNYVKALDSAIEKAPPLEDDIVVHRGRQPDELLDMFMKDEEHLAEGMVFTDHGYAPTSFSRSTANDFAGSSKYPKSVGTFTIPKGTKVAYSEMISHYGESEVLPPRGQRYKITRAWRETYKGTAYFRVEGIILPPE